MASSTAKLVARAFERAETRHRIMNPDAEPSFDVLLREALVEVQVTLSMRRERDHKRIRKAVRRMHAAEELLARVPSIAAVVEPPSGADGFGPWHPDHPLHMEN